MKRLLYSLCGFLLALGLGKPVRAEEDTSKLTARQLFFTARPVSAKADAPAAVSEVVKETPPPKAVRKAVSKKPPRNIPAPAAKPAEEAAKAAEQPAKEAEPAKSQAVEIPYLGLRYSLLQDKPGGTRQEVDPDKVFHSKERFYLSLESNDAAYLYVIVQASQGDWEVLFPNSEIDHGNNRLNARTPVLVPSPANPFVFDESPGTEKLFIVLSRQPEPDLNELVRSVQTRQPGREVAPAEKNLLAANNVDRIRGQMALASRGIKVEGVKSGENAVYLVNTAAQQNSRVIADIVLKHE